MFFIINGIVVGSFIVVVLNIVYNVFFKVKKIE